MGIWSSLCGSYTIQITSASVTDVLTAINKTGVELRNIYCVNELQLYITILRTDYCIIESITKRMGCQCEILKRHGIYWTLQGLLKRPVLIVGCLMILFLAVYLPTRVLFVQIEGNEEVSAVKILDKAELCGIRFGASRRLVRSEKVKNALLSALPDLQWAGVNTVGCVAIITVRERSQTNSSSTTDNICSIVASRDGIIQEITVTKGNPLCVLGQVVQKGQVLVSGYTDLGLSIQAHSAEAEVYAQTRWVLNTVTPISTEKRMGQKKRETNYRLRIGKNIINLCKDSGISDTTCVKMKKEYDLKLPGGFSLPVCLIVETVESYTTVLFETDDPSEYLWMKELSDRLLNDQMISGDILIRTYDSVVDSDNYCQIGRYICKEMIGRKRSEEYITGNGKRD